MGSSYYQFCPIAKAMELLDERWTLLLVRELATGSEHFNDLRRGLPRMSPALLVKRLQQLVRAGVVERLAEGRDVRYLLTPAGQELRPVVEALGVWGTRWIGVLGDRDLDPQLLLWDMHRNIDLTAIPPMRTVLQFTFSEIQGKGRHWWLLISPDGVDVCDQDPGYAVDIQITGALRALVEVWRGDLPWEQALRSGAISIDGPKNLRRAMPKWFTLSNFAPVPRPARPAASSQLRP